MPLPRLLAFATGCLLPLLAACRDVTAVGQLEFSASVSRTAFAPPDSVTIRLLTVNRSLRTIRLSGSSGGTFWVEVVGPSGDAAASVRGYADDLRFWELAPGDSVIVIWPWTGRALPGLELLPPGTYALRGRLTANEGTAVSAPVPLTIGAAAP